MSDDHLKGDASPGLPDTETEDSGLTELLAGLMFIAIGGLALFLGRDYPIGTALDMGPGYIPRVVSFGLMGMGAIGVVRGALARDWRRFDLPIWPMVWVGVAIIAFALLIGRAGLFISHALQPC